MLRPFLRQRLQSEVELLIVPDHDGQTAFVAGEFEVKVEEMFGAAKVGGHVGWIADFDEAKWFVEGGEFVHTGEPEGTAVHLLQLSNDGAGNPLLPPSLDHGNGSQFAGAAPVWFDLTAANDTAVPVHHYYKPLPLQAQRVDAYFFDEFFDGRLIVFNSRA